MSALPWQHPLDVARPLARRGEPLALLYSGLRTPDSGRYSYLATDPAAVTTGSDFRLPAARPLVGWLGYGLRQALESLPPDAPGPLTLPDSWWMQPDTFLRFDHEAHTITPEPGMPEQGTPEALPAEPAAPAYAAPPIAELASNFSKTRYLHTIERTLEQIHAGNFYQANITRKFYGRFTQTPDAFALFTQLCAVSPAPYSAFIQYDDTAVISSSPERFLHIDANGRVTAQPIKGSAPRGSNTAEDEALREALYHSAKDRAENLMIVDLMRHDLARACEPGSVRVDELYGIRRYATIHQMVSTISGQRRADADTVEVVRGCFPPGSMTGAPKIRAMQWCAEQEQLARGVYSGAIGRFDAQGGCDLSVVIRTLIVQGDRFEFQVGGGIVADSHPHREWEETLVKARALAAVLGIPMERLQAI